MLESHRWLSLVPPLLAVFMAFRLRKIFVALFLSLWIGAALLANGNPVRGLFGAFDRCLAVLMDEESLKVILFCCFIGAIMAFSQRSGGIAGFMDFVSRRKLGNSRRKAEFLTVAMSALIPVESSINVLVPATISRPIYDNLMISRQKLAFLCLSFCAPICTLFPVNAWGAYVSGIMGAAGVSHPFRAYLKALPMNFYAIFTIVFALLLIATQKDFFEMARAEKRAGDKARPPASAGSLLISNETYPFGTKTGVVPRASNMLMPVAAMTLLMIVGMLITGHGRFMDGAGATSVFYAVTGAIAVAAVKYRLAHIMDLDEIVDLFIKGVGGMMGLGLLLVLSFALSRLCLDMRTGAFVAGATQHLIHPKFLPALLFVATGFIAFSTGTSWGTWAIMLPVGMAYGSQTVTAPSLMIGAIISGGVFANHCSPFSSEPIICSLATQGDHIENMKSVLPYALVIAGFTAAVYLVMGFVLY